MTTRQIYSPVYFSRNVVAVLQFLSGYSSECAVTLPRERASGAVRGSAGQGAEGRPFVLSSSQPQGVRLPLGPFLRALSLREAAYRTKTKPRNQPSRVACRWRLQASLQLECWSAGVREKRDVPLRKAVCTRHADMGALAARIAVALLPDTRYPSGPAVIRRYSELGNCGGPGPGPAV